MTRFLLAFLLFSPALAVTGRVGAGERAVRRFSCSTGLDGETASGRLSP